MGRKLRIVHAAMIPSATSVHKSLAPKCTFASGSRVYARDYHADHPQWAQDTIHKRCGSRLYDVKVGSETWVRHQNQLGPRHEQSLKRTATSISIPLDILTDTFTLPVHKLAEPLEPNLRARRFTNRVRRSVRPFQVDPEAKRYQ
ncbi:unnamed protein product [Echinostoma caproni]|uniref:Uncharacterized protein n=1 Tax=Echinostoma caproni TaxID=27848 RepID=A0A183A2W0_9TREM|nr:unnamed protein product [Echinostoma caproni]